MSNFPAIKFPFRPRLLDSLQGYKMGDFWADVSAGITVGVVALPLAMAFAIASGLKPEAGIFTAIIAGLIISSLGGSRVQIGGPAGAFIVIVYGIVAKYGVDGLIISTILAGCLLFAMGLLRLGNLVRFVPVSIVIGFTNGIAVLIALSQIKDLLGLQIEKMPSGFFAQLGAIYEHLGTINPPTVALAVVSALIVFNWSRIARQTGNPVLQRIPGSIIALVVGTTAVALIGLPVATIGSKFGGIPSGLPHIVFPHIDLETLQNLIPPTITIALLGAIESLLCARVADGLIDDRHNPNQELMAQGLANIAAPLFGGYCATGTIARTVTNVRSGAKTPIAGIIHAVTLLLIILVAAPLAKNIPLATLGAILLFVSYNMGEWHEFVRMKHFSNNYRAILMSTFILTVVVDLTVAVEVGLVLSCLFFITRISGLTRLDPVPEMEMIGHPHLNKDVEAYRISGSLFFGAVHKVEELIEPGRPVPKILILSTSGLLNMDTSGLEAMENVERTLQKRGCRLILCDLSGQPLSLMQRSGFLNHLGAGNVYPTLNAALDDTARILPASA